MSETAASTQDSAGVERTATGAIATQTQTTAPEATTAQTSTTSEGEEKSLLNQTEKSLANQKPADQPTGAPETYATFNVPDGYELDEKVAKEAGEIFKSMGLSQDQAQKLVDFYTAKTTESANRPYQVWNETQQKWVREVKADAFLGPRLGQVTSTISRAIDQVSESNPKLAEQFREVMDFTGAGNHPAFIRMFYELASMVTEGGHVAGKGPSAGGQQQPDRPASAAKAMYPNLP